MSEELVDRLSDESARLRKVYVDVQRTGDSMGAIYASISQCIDALAGRVLSIPCAYEVLQDEVSMRLFPLSLPLSIRPPLPPSLPPSVRPPLPFMCPPLSSFVLSSSLNPESASACTLHLPSRAERARHSQTWPPAPSFN